MLFLAKTSLRVPYGWYHLSQSANNVGLMMNILYTNIKVLTLYICLFCQLLCFCGCITHINHSSGNIEGSWELSSIDRGLGGRNRIIHKIVLDFDRSLCCFQLCEKSESWPYTYNKYKRQLLLHINDGDIRQHMCMVDGDLLYIYNFGRRSDLGVNEESESVYIFKKRAGDQKNGKGKGVSPIN